MCLCTVCFAVEEGISFTATVKWTLCLKILKFYQRLEPTDLYLEHLPCTLSSKNRRLTLQATNSFSIRSLIFKPTFYISKCLNLSSKNEVDIDNCQRITAAAKPLPVTFHRAFDHCNNWQKSINCIIDAGFSTILTRYHTVKFLSVAFKRQSVIPLQASYISFSSSSGKQKIVIEGVSLLREITKEYKGRIEIMAGQYSSIVTIILFLHSASKFSYGLSFFLFRVWGNTRKHICASKRSSGLRCSPQLCFRATKEFTSCTQYHNTLGYL